MALNPNPVVYAVKPTVKRRRHDNGELLHQHDDLLTSALVDDSTVASSTDRDPVDSDEVFELIRHLADPEHPLTLEQLHVVRAEHVTVDVRAPLFIMTMTKRLDVFCLISVCVCRTPEITFLFSSRRPFRTAQWPL
jgi:hypothetical protein